MVPGDRLLCVLLDPLKEGSEFRGWPLHITIVPWFRTDTTTETLAEALAQSLRGIKPFRAAVAGEARFGRRRKPVSLIQSPGHLTELEAAARRVLRSYHAWIVDETTKVRRPFRPHVTAQKSGRVHEGDQIMCDNLYIIEQKGDCKLVLSQIHL